MLVLSRMLGETIVIDGVIRVTVVRLGRDGGRVHLGIDAPKSVSVLREEIWLEKQDEAKE